MTLVKTITLRVRPVSSCFYPSLMEWLNIISQACSSNWLFMKLACSCHRNWLVTSTWDIINFDNFWQFYLLQILSFIFSADNILCCVRESHRKHCWLPKLVKKSALLFWDFPGPKSHMFLSWFPSTSSAILKFSNCHKMFSSAAAKIVAFSTKPT